MKILSTADYRSMPWKNGAGSTIEIAVFPEHAQLNDFAWRVSRAQVIADGDFSHFAHVDRSLALLQGNGMCITTDTGRHQVDQRNNIVRFAGDVVAYARLLDGAITDFNLMTCRSKCDHHLNHWVGQAIRQIPGGTMLLYCAAGGGRLTGGGESHELGADQTIQFSEADDLSRFSLHSDPGSRFYCAQISHVQISFVNS